MVVELEVGRKYSTKELCAAIGVKYDNFKKQKNSFLKSLSMAYDYDVEYKGRATFYIITEKKGDYQKPERKNSREKTDAIIKEFINEIIDEDPIQTAANINRRAWENADTNPSSIVLLGLKEGTTGEYIRINLREMYGTVKNNGGTDGMIEKRIWCRLDAEYNCYVEMSDEMIDELFKFVNDAKKGHMDFESNVAEDFANGLISKAEMFELLGETTFNSWQDGKKSFHEKYGYWPIKVPVYVKNAWIDDSKRYQAYEF